MYVYLQISSLPLGLKNVCTVEELERNLRQQQPQVQSMQSSQQKPPMLLFQVLLLFNFFA